MKLTVIRTDMLPDKTFGLLDVDGTFLCHVLEDPDRKVECGGTKCVDDTAIPRGTYPVVLDFSARFKKTMPHVLSVPLFAGIRIHCGNTTADTSGCLLLGASRTTTGVAGSLYAYNKLMALLTMADGPITLEVR